jgi:hypothetical protein
MKKNLKHMLSRLVLLVSLFAAVQFTYAQAPVSTTPQGTGDADNAADITDVGNIKDWRTFEINVGKSLTQATAYYQVYLDVNGTTIIADYLVKTATGYKVIDAKASKTVKLYDPAYNIMNRCTANQKVAYPTINAGAVANVTVKTARNSLAGTNPLPATITLDKGVSFYVNNIEGQYVNFSTR